ncbi:candidapepsin-5 [Candida albicans P57072]|nr:candidapepsin-5 [Candida albicans P57072]
MRSVEMVMWTKEDSLQLLCTMKLLLISSILSLVQITKNLMLLLTSGLSTCGFQIQTLFVFQNGVVTKETSVRVSVLIPQHLPALPKI